MTQSTPSPQIPVGYGRADARRQANVPAVASLVFGVLGCIPFVPGGLALLLGIIGLRKSRNPSIGGGGLAVAGLVLGIVSLLGWSGFAGLFTYGYLESKPAAIVAKQFLQDVSGGNVNSALGNSTGMTAAQLQTNNSQMAPFGALQSVDISGFNYSAFNGKPIMHLQGVATFSGGPKTCRFDLVKMGGMYKVTSYRIH